MPLGVFAEDVDFDIEQAAGSEGAEAGGLVGVGDDGDFDLVTADGGDGETDAFNGDGALRHDVMGKVVGKLDAKAPVGMGCLGRDGVERKKDDGAVDVALDDVAAEWRTGGGGELEVDDGVRVQVHEGGTGDGFGGEVGGEAWWEGVGFNAKGSEADAVYGDAVAGVEAEGERGCGDSDARCAFGGGDGEEGAGGFDETSEHDYRVMLPLAGCQFSVGQGLWR